MIITIFIKESRIEEEDGIVMKGRKSKMSQVIHTSNMRREMKIEMGRRRSQYNSLSYSSTTISLFSYEGGGGSELF